jgi:hypothetical protein
VQAADVAGDSNCRTLHFRKLQAHLLSLSRCLSQRDIFDPRPFYSAANKREIHFLLHDH